MGLFARNQAFEYCQHALTVLVDAIEVRAERTAEIPRAHPLFGDHTRHIDVLPQRVEGMAAQEEAIEESRFALGGQRVGVVNGLFPCVFGQQMVILAADPGWIKWHLAAGGVIRRAAAGKKKAGRRGTNTPGAPRLKLRTRLRHPIETTRPGGNSVTVRQAVDVF